MTVFTPRGIRNNNPGNIRISKTRWQGQKVTQEDMSFVEFDAPLFGLRAMMRVLMNYHLKHGLNTVMQVIYRWAPPYENATDHYIHVVSRAMKVKRTDVLNFKDKNILISLAKAIVAHENGGAPAGKNDWYPHDLYQQAADIIF